MLKPFVKLGIVTFFIFVACNLEASAESIISKVKLDHTGAGIAVNPSTNKIYVGSSNLLLNLDDNKVSIVDGLFHEIETVLDFEKSSLDVDVYVNPSSNRFYVVNNGFGEEGNLVSNLFIYDGNENNLLQEINIGFPTFLSINPKTNIVYILNYTGFGKVGVLNEATGNIQTIDPQIGTSLIAVSVNPETNKFYVVNAADGKIAVIDGTSNSVSSTINLSSPSDTTFHLAVNTKTNKLYVSDFTANKIHVIDGNTNQIETSIPIVKPLELAVNPETNRIYVYDNVMNALCAINGETNKVEDVIILGGIPNGVAVNPATNKIYVTNVKFNKLVVIDGSITTSTSIVNQLRNAFDELGFTQSQLTEGALSKRLGNLIKKLDHILSDLQATTCKKANKILLPKISKVISKIGLLIDNALRDSTDKNEGDMKEGNCITPGLFESDVTPLGESFSIIETIFSIDEDSNKVPDVCE